MKYKLIKYNNIKKFINIDDNNIEKIINIDKNNIKGFLNINKNNIKGFIDIDGIFNLYEIMNKKIIKSFNYNLNLIQNNPEYYKIYNSLVQKIDNIIKYNSRYNKKQTKYKNHINDQIKNINQLGGQFPVFIPFIMSGISSSLIVGMVIAYIIVKIFTKPSCRSIYPISIDKDVPEYKQIISNLIPKYVIEKYFPNFDNIDEQGIISSTTDFLNTFSVIISIISPKSVVGQLASQTVELAAGVAVTALEGLTAGATVVINYLLKAFNLLKDAIGLLFNLIEAILKIIETITDDVFKKLLNDILMIDFSNGPFGVKCWIEYIFSKYGYDNKFVETTCTIFNNILSMIYDKLIAFISKTISFSIPDGGISGVLFAGIISLMKCTTYEFALLKLNQTYDKISYDNQILFERPPLMKKTLDSYIKKAKKFIDFFDKKVVEKLSKDISIYNFMSTNTEFFAFILNKMFAMVFAMMQVLSMCAKREFCDPTKIIKQSVSIYKKKSDDKK